MNSSTILKCIELLKGEGIYTKEKEYTRNMLEKAVIDRDTNALNVITMLKKELTLSQLNTPSAKGKYRLMDKLLKKMPDNRPILKSLHYDGKRIICTNSYYLFEFDANKFNFDGLTRSDSMEGRYPDVDRLTNEFPTDQKWDFDLKQMKADKKLKVKFYDFNTENFGPIRVDLDFLINILDMFDNDVEIGFSGNVKPIYFRHNQSKSKALLLPVRIF